jgi:iron(III) transport system permease protein
MATKRGAGRWRDLGATRRSTTTGPEAARRPTLATISASRARRALPTLPADPALLIPLVGVVVLVYLAVLPLVMLFWGSFQAEVAPREYEFTLDNYAAAYASQYTYSTLRNSLAFAMGAALLSFVMGGVLAWFVERTNLPFRGAFLPLGLVPLVMPGVLEAIAWIFLLSPKIGYVNLAIMNLFGLPSAPFDVFSLGGMIWVQAIGQAPLAFLLMLAAFKSMDPSLEESALMSGASLWATVRRITLPLLLPAVGSVLLILFVRSIEAFEVPAIIGIPSRTFVYTSEIWIAFTEFPPDYGRGAALAVGLLALSGFGVWLYTRVTGRHERFQTVTGQGVSTTPVRPRAVALGGLRRAVRLLRPDFAAAVPGALVELLPAVRRTAERPGAEPGEPRQLRLPARLRAVPPRRDE